jgi:heme/copper-type cytochrome/quinol oxidase subunit 3
MLPDPRAARHRETTAMLGMSLFVASWAMLFAALFFAYGVTRARALAWPPADLPALPLGLPALATVAIAGSSAALAWARRRLRRTNDPRCLQAPLLFTTLAAAIFVAIQLTVWRALYQAGLRPDGGTYASVFYGLTTFHALHVLVGIVGLASLLPAALRPRASAKQTATVTSAISLRLWTVYFHMVGVLWLLLFIGVYCL